MFDSTDLKDITSAIKAELNKSMEEVAYGLWFSSMTVLKMTDMVLFICVSAQIQQITIETRYMEILKKAVCALYKLDVEIKIYNNQTQKVTKELLDADERKLILPAPFEELNADLSRTNIFDQTGAGKNNADEPDGKADQKPEKPRERTRYSTNSELGRGIEPSELPPRRNTDAAPEGDVAAQRDVFGNEYRDMRRNFTFDNFVVGSSNRLAYVNATVIAQYPGTEYNPFFIWGPPGLGKTHLLYAISNQTSKNYKNAKVIYIKGEEFTNELIDSITRRSTNAFRDKYRSCDMLLIDDIQFIAGKEVTQEEVFHTFNALYEDGRQIVLTSDRPPRDLKTLENRLTSRFESGLIVDIQPPDLDLRVAICRKKSDDMGIKITNEVLFFLAENITLNIRQIEGAIKKLNAYSYISSSGITLQLAKDSISDIISGTEPTNVTVDKVLSLVSKQRSVSIEEIKGRKRTKEIVYARHITIYIIRKITDLSLPAIGKIFERDHSTILSAIEAIEENIKTDTDLKTKIDEICRTVSQ